MSGEWVYFSALKKGQQIYTFSIDVMIHFRFQRGGPANLKNQGDISKYILLDPPLAITGNKLIFLCFLIKYIYD